MHVSRELPQSGNGRGFRFNDLPLENGSQCVSACRHEEECCCEKLKSIHDAVLVVHNVIATTINIKWVRCAVAKRREEGYIKLGACAISSVGTFHISKYSCSKKEEFLVTLPELAKILRTAFSTPILDTPKVWILGTDTWRRQKSSFTIQILVLRYLDTSLVCGAKLTPLGIIPQV